MPNGLDESSARGGKGGRAARTHRSDRILVGCAKAGVIAGGRMENEMAFRRRKRPAVAWLPVLGQGEQSARSYVASSTGVLTGGAISTTIHALLPDYPAEAAANVQVQSLADYEESGYRLRRIVGKFFVAYDQDLGVDGVTVYPESVLVAAAFIVLKVEPSTGAPLQAATPLNYSPLLKENVRDPWIWRRTWLLSDSFANGGQVETGMSEFPRTNAEYGSAFDGPHIDARTARRVSAEERLFLVVSTQTPGNQLTDNTAGRIRYVMEARYLTSPLRVMGNRRNASR